MVLITSGRGMAIRARDLRGPYFIAIEENVKKFHSSHFRRVILPTHLLDNLCQPFEFLHLGKDRPEAFESTEDEEAYLFFSKTN